MTGRFYSTPIGNTLPPGAEIVWNGTHDKQLAEYWHAQAIQPVPHVTHVSFGQPPRASFDAADSNRECDRVLRYLVVHRFTTHTSRSISDALGLDIHNASVWLARFTKRGVLERGERIPGKLGGRASHVYRVVPMAGA